MYPRNHVRGNENKSVVTGQPCVIFSRRPPSSSSSSSPSLRRPPFHSRKFYTTVLDDSWRRRRRGFGRKYDGERSNLFVSLEKGRMMRLLGRRRNDDVLGSDATSPPYLTRQFLFESYFPTLAFECSSCNSAGTRELSNVGRVR